MQRRAAAVYFVLFVLIGAGAYGFLQVGMGKPMASLDGPTYEAGDQLRVDGQTYEVTAVEGEPGEESTQFAGSVELSPPGSDETVTLTEGGNSTVNGVSHFAHFTSNTTVQILPSQEFYGAYRGELSDLEYWNERRNGVWGIVILSVIAGIILLATAYLPVKG